MPPVRHKRLKPGEKLTERIAPRISTQEKAFLKAAALKKRLTLSHFVGDAIIEQAELALGMSYEEWEMIHSPKQS